MDDKAQVSIEYMLILSVLIAIAAAVSLFATNLFGLKESTKEVNSGLKRNLDSMWLIK